MTPERALQQRVLAWLKTQGGAWFNICPSQWSMIGLPDIIGCYKGRFISFELKQPKRFKNALHGCSPAQLRIGKMILDAGGVWIATDSLEVIKNILASVEDFQSKTT